MGVGWLVVIALIVLPVSFALWSAIPDAWVEERGVTAPARIVSLRKTGTVALYDPVVRFRVRVAPTDGTPAFETSFEFAVSSIDGPHMQAGSEIRVKHLRYDHAWVKPLADWREP